MRYETSIPFDGEAMLAFDAVITSLTPAGFKVKEATPDSLSMSGPGMNSTRESPVLGATEVRLLARESSLALEADLGGVERMTRFVRLFPPLLSIGICLVVGFVLYLQFGQQLPTQVFGAIGFVALANSALWIVLAPMISRRMRSRTCLALDALLTNAATVASR